MAGQTNGKSAEPFFVKHNKISVQRDEIMGLLRRYIVLHLYSEAPSRNGTEPTMKSFVFLPKNEHPLEILKLCMMTFFTFQNLPHERIKGNPTGSSISSYISKDPNI